MKIKWKLILAVLIVSVITNSLFTVYLLKKERKRQEGRLSVKIDTYKDLFERTSSGPIWDVDVEKLEDNLRSFLKDPEIAAIHLKDVTGTISIDLSDAEAAQQPGETIEDHLVLEKDAYKLGQISITYTTALVERKLKEIRHEMVMLTLGLIVLTSTAIFLISVFLLRPIEQIVSALIRVDQGDHHSSLQMGRRDEFKEIEIYFNRMVKTIHEEIHVRKQKEKESKRNEERYRSIFQFVGVSIWEEDLTALAEAIAKLRTEGVTNLRSYLEENPAEIQRLAEKVQVLDVNDETLQMFKAKDKDAILQSLKETFTPRSLQVFREAVISFAEGDHGFECEVEYQTLEGGRLDAILRISFPREGNEQPTRALLSIMDMTERKEIERRLNQMQRMETIGSLAGGFAHNFNNILGSIIGAVSLIKLDLASATRHARLSEDIGTIELAANRAADMVQQLLALSSQRVFTMAPLDLNESLKNVITLCSASFSSNIEISVSYSEKGAMCQGDSMLIEQVLLNVLINAAHALTIMRPDGAPQGGSITASIEEIYSDSHFSESHFEAQVGRYWVIRISDTGVGMSKKTADQIFEPFFSTKDKKIGTGLGLSLVYNTVRDHDGFVDVYSNPGTGTSVNIFLPLISGETSEQESEKMDAVAIEGTGLLLIVEDEEIIRNSVKRFLVECGYQVVTAENGREGVEIFRLRHSEVCLTLLDMVMPEKCGDDAFLEMRRIDPNAKILITSGFAQDPRVKHVTAEGANGFIQKPFAMGTLLDKIRDVLT